MSTVPAVKKGVRNWLRTITGLRPTDGVTVKGAPPGPDAPGEGEAPGLRSAFPGLRLPLSATARLRLARPGS